MPTAELNEKKTSHIPSRNPVTRAVEVYLSPTMFGPPRRYIRDRP